MTELSTADASELAAPAPRSRWLWRTLRLAIDLGVVATLGGAIAGFYLRDRVPSLAVLTYFPLAPVALAALVWDLMRRGRVLGRARFALSIVAVVFIVIGGRWMWATKPLAEVPASHESGAFRLVHWNVKWGGTLRTQGANWDAIAAALTDQAPDIVVLAEAPKSIADDDADWNFADGWSTVRWYGKNASNAYYWSVVVSARGSVREVWRRYIPQGVALCVEVGEGPGRRRIMVVDGVSDPRRDRVPFLHAIADLAEQAAADEPIDVIVGDFNAVSRSVGFDRFEADPLNLHLAARHGSGWRATGPAILPLIDVDHAWLAPHVRVFAVDRFTSPATDHVGYTLDLLK